MQLLLAIFFCLVGIGAASAQTRIIVNDTSSSTATAATKFHYVFENEKFTTPRIELAFDVSGHGEFKFRKKEGEEIVNKLQITSTVLEQISSLLTELNFLDSAENYQHKKDFSHLGTITIAYTKDGKNRQVNFNYTDNPAMNKLANIFRNIATQETRVFEIETIRQSDPISTPAQLRYLESELKSKNIADPERFTAILQDIKLDEAVPLIARNHADRLLKEIKKTK